MKTIYFVRHGETEANVGLIMSGGEHNTDLTTKGRSQAKKAGQDLKDRAIELIVTSPQRRAHETAKIIAQEIRYDPIKIVTNNLFVESYMGAYSGKPYEVFYADRDKGTIKEGVETPEQHYERIHEAVESLRQLQQETILVVSHGATGRMTKLVVQGSHYRDYHTIDRIGNCEVYEFTLDDVQAPKLKYKPLQRQR